MFEVRFSRQAEKQALKLPPAHRRRLRTIVEKLRESPFAYPFGRSRADRDTTVFGRAVSVSSSESFPKTIKSG